MSTINIKTLPPSRHSLPFPTYPLKTLPKKTKKKIFLNIFTFLTFLSFPSSLFYFYPSLLTPYILLVVFCFLCRLFQPYLSSRISLSHRSAPAVRRRTRLRGCPPARKKITGALWPFAALGMTASGNCTSDLGGKKTGGEDRSVS